MELTNEQIQKLFAFTERKFVRWYDLQCELVDHLATKIESEISADNKLDFDKALNKVYEGFGIFGFAQIVKERENQLRKTNNKLLWGAVKAQFTWPNLVRSLAILSIIYTSVFVVGLKISIFIYVVAYITTTFLSAKNFYRWRPFQRNKKGRGVKKNLLMLSTLPSFGLLPFFYFQFLVNKSLAFFDSDFNYSQGEAFFFVGFLFLGTILFLASSKISKNVLQKAKAMYPEAFA
jgi:hypothetical protein